MTPRPPTVIAVSDETSESIGVTWEMHAPPQPNFFFLLTNSFMTTEMKRGKQETEIYSKPSFRWCKDRKKKKKLKTCIQTNLSYLSNFTPL